MIMKPLSSFFLTSFPLPETIPPNCAHAGLGASPGAPMAHSKACRMHGWHTQGLRVRIRGIQVMGHHPSLSLPSSLSPLPSLPSSPSLSALLPSLLNLRSGTVGQRCKGSVRGLSAFGVRCSDFTGVRCNGVTLSPRLG